MAVLGCSRKNDSFINRNWHAMTARYNTLYNGNRALELGIEEMNQNYQDYYWEILPVERMHISETVLPPGTVINPNFQVAEQKAVKAIQRHSMLIEGRERNPNIDEAYLLLGKARYYDQRFVPALEAFNYILHKYPLSDNINEARIWREKVNIRLEFNELAIENLQEVLKEEDLNEDAKAHASAMLGQAFLNIGHPDSAVGPIKRAAELIDDKETSGRYWFIAGQIYERIGKPDSASRAFDKVIDLHRKTERIYYVNAQIKKIEGTDVSPEEKAVVLRELEALAADRENRAFLDKIYFQLAEFHYQQDSVDLAIQYYNQSLRSPGENAYLQSLDYETLGNIYFDAAQYEMAGSYYDSTLTRLPEDSRAFRLIRRKRDNLDEVIHYEELARQTDSILYLASLPREEQIEFFRDYTENLKQGMKDQPELENQLPASAAFFENKRTPMPGIPDPTSSFYFYNPTAVAYGKQEFFRIWGDRKLVDQWRTNAVMDAEGDLDSVGATEVLENDPRFNPEVYVARIPDDPSVIDSLWAQRNFANYQLGLMYSEKFGEFRTAAEKLQFVLDHEPEEQLLIPAKYHLYKIFEQLGERARAQAIRNDIIHNHGNSRYAEILLNPGSGIAGENSASDQYDRLYSDYREQKFKEVVSGAEQMISEFAGDPIIPQVELLKALAAGRLFGYQRYRQELDFVAMNYPQTEEGKKAQDLLKSLEQTLGDKNFRPVAAGASFKVILPFSYQDTISASRMKEELLKFMEKNHFSDRSISLDVYDENTRFLVVHGFRTFESAREFAQTFAREEQVQQKYFYISAENYRIAQIHKNIETYLDQLTQISP